MNDVFSELDDLDVLSKELEGRNFIKDAGNLANHYLDRNNPYRNEYLGTIR